jgi:hypothetical protein
MSESRQIYVKLLDEGIDVWRPVEADLLRGEIYRVSEQPYDRESEVWEFEPGDVVVAELTESSGGPMLAATRLSSDP